MKKHRILFWLVAFSALTGFTVMTLGNFNGRAVQVAYAKTISSEPNMAQVTQFVVPNPVKDAPVFGNFLQKFSRKVNHQRELCGLSEEQSSVLAGLYPMDQDMLNVQDRDVSVGTFSENGPSLQEMNAALTGAGLGTVECTEFTVNQKLFLLFSAHLS